jgi:hypothetical protein
VTANDLRNDPNSGKSILPSNHGRKNFVSPILLFFSRIPVTVRVRRN